MAKSIKQNPYSILIVDDAPDNLRLLAKILGGRGYKVRLAPSGAHALRTVEKESPDLILLDIRMPKMDGYEVCKRLKKKKAFRNIPVIFLSAASDLEDKVFGFKAGGVDYITKPIQVEDVIVRVETHLKLGAARAGVAKTNAELEQMIDLNPQVMLLVDTTGTIMRANRALLDFLCVTDFDALLGKRLDDVFRCKDSEFIFRLLQGQSGCETGEAQVEMADQQTRSLKFTVAGLWKDRSWFVVMVSDIGAEKEQAKHLEKEHKKEAVKALIGSLMHNFNQILTVIMVKAHLMNIEIERGSRHPGEIQKGLQDIMRMTTEIADLLKGLEHIEDFVTEPYLGDTRILDIKRSSGSTHGIETV